MSSTRLIRPCAVSPSWSRLSSRRSPDAALLRRGYAASATASDQARIVEVGPRDGLQNEKSVISLDTKLELIRRLAGTGVRDMEAGSFVAPNWVPQVCSIDLCEIGLN